ncbi:MAG: molybdenum cofactor biosynthesis protein MoaE [Hyphomicrobiales bacterium]
MIRVQKAPFDLERELRALKGENHKIGGVAMFIGTVRDLSGAGAVRTMTLEHYPGMTERALEAIDVEAHRRWPLEASLVIHRYGRLEPGDDIVLVITASAHREAAFEACQFLMDWLKTKAPFWKSEETPEGAHWVEADSRDDAAANRWERR